MKRTPVKSSTVLSVGYDSVEKILEVEFANAIYQYLNVPQEEYEGLISASSVGKYLHKNIIKVYRCNKI